MRTIHADLTTNELAYLAGIVDGEGTIQIIKQSPRGTEKEEYALRLRISNTSRDLIDWINERVGGNYRSLPARGKNHKAAYQLQWGGERTIEVVTLILPYLVIKRAQAILALIFGEHSSFTLGYGKVHKDKQKFICQEMRKLNHRGVL